MVTLDADGDFVVELFLSKVQFEQPLLRDGHLDLTVGRREGIEGLLRETIGLDGIKTIVCLRSVVDQEDRVLEFLLRLKELAKDFAVESKAHTRVHVEANFIRVHQTLGLVFECLQKPRHLHLVGSRHSLRHEEAIFVFILKLLGDSHKEALRARRHTRSITAVLDEVEQSGCLDNDTPQSRALVGLQVHHL